MHKYLHLAFLLLFTSFSYNVVGQAQPAESTIEQEIAKLSSDERHQLLSLLGNGYPETDEKLHEILKNIGPDKQAEIQQYIILIKNKGFQPYALVQYSKDTIDFGLIKIGGIYRDTVQFTISGLEPYQITGVSSSCVHISVKKPEFPVMQGQDENINFEFNTRRLNAGPFRAVVSVRGNNYPNRRKLIYIKAELVDQKDLKLVRRP
jgi:hypothetical protein